jgi:hypothetical protein
LEKQDEAVRIQDHCTVSFNWQPSGNDEVGTAKRNWLLAIGFPSDHHTSNLLILMTMKDRVDRGSPESSRFSVTEKSEFQASTAE